MRTMLLLLALISAGCGYDPCSEHTHPTDDPGTCEADCGWQPGSDGESVVPLDEVCYKVSIQ